MLVETTAKSAMGNCKHTGIDYLADGVRVYERVDGGRRRGHSMKGDFGSAGYRRTHCLSMVVAGGIHQRTLNVSPSHASHSL